MERKARRRHIKSEPQLLHVTQGLAMVTAPLAERDGTVPSDDPVIHPSCAGDDTRVVVRIGAAERHGRDLAERLGTESVRPYNCNCSHSSPSTAAIALRVSSKAVT